MRVAAIGRSEILYATIERLVRGGHEIAAIITAREAPEYEVGVEDFEALAERLDVPFFRAARIEQRVGELRALGPIDVAVSVNHPALVSQEVIDCFPLGLLNAHAGDLPRYRGNACQAWAIINGEDRSGLCIHKMVADKLDSGDILARDYHPLTPRTKVGELWEWAKTRVPILFEEAVQALERDPSYVLERQSNDPAQALRCYPRRPDDGRIDWSRTAAELLRLINASGDPYQGAFCDLDGTRLAIWDAEPVDDRENFLAVPGQITAIGDGWVRVATGQGKLQLNLVGNDGTRCPPAELIKSTRTRLR